ncbi:MAG: hypothetical protein V3U07_00875 [Nitrospirales bacterium]
MPIHRSMIQPCALISFPLTRLTSASVGLGHAFLLMSFVTCLTIGYAIEPALGTPTADDIMKALPISDSKKQDVLNGEVVKWTTTEAGERELAVGVIMLMKATPEKAVQLFRGAEGYKLTEAITAFGSISGKGTEADFSKMVLEPNGEKEAARYLEAEPGEDFNLDKMEIAAFQALKTESKDGGGNQKAVEALIRKNFLARLQAYQAKGLAGVSPYERGDNEERISSQEILLSVDANKILAKLHPKFNEVLHNYPSGDMTGVEESFMWLNIEVFSRPLLVLTHRMLYKDGDAYVAADRHFYASHEYNSLQAVGGVWPKDGGSLLVYLYRVSTDQVGGFGSSAKHPISRALMGPYVEELFEKIRAQ